MRNLSHCLSFCGTNLFYHKPINLCKLLIWNRFNIGLLFNNIHKLANIIIYLTHCRKFLLLPKLLDQATKQYAFSWALFDRFTTLDKTLDIRSVFVAVTLGLTLIGNRWSILLHHSIIIASTTEFKYIYSSSVAIFCIL